MKKFVIIISLFALSISQLTAQNYNELFFVFLNNNPDKEKISESEVATLQAKHLKNIEKLAEEGKILTAGPFEGGGGMFIISAKDRFQAWDYLETDPAIKANRFNIEVLPYEIWSGELGSPKKPYNMVNYQFIRLISNPNFQGDENNLIHDNRIFMGELMRDNEEVLIYGFFSEYNDGMVVINGSKEFAEQLIKEHGSIKAGQLTYEIKTLYVAKGSFVNTLH
ncbi:MAG: hypothetical protein C0598_01545 [Marinilabiliales bacterium]|nr:MAG: hypothetical protein C0598_01545 [Marinilabiliales bacterium]